MWSPEELGEDAGPEHPTRRDDVPGRAHQKIREVRPRRQAAHHPVGERGPPHADPDESLEQPLPAEFAPARAVVGRERRGVEAAQGGDQALGQELGAPQRSVNPLARERIEEVGGVTHEHGAASGRDGGARPLRERTGGQNVANQSPWVEPPREPGKSVELGEKIATEVPAFAPAPAHRRERHHERHRGDAVADRSEAHVTALAHVQLAHTVHPRDVRHVRRERDAPRGRRADDPEPAGDHRAQAIGAHDDACVARYTLPATVRESFRVARACGDTRDRSPLPQQVLHRGGLAHLSPRPRRRGHENRVERSPWQGKAVWAGAAADDGDIPAAGHDAAVSTAAPAPTSVAARFTPSLSSHRHPLASRTGSWHTVLPRSNRASQAGHSYLPCSVAPRKESASIPATPAAVSVTNPGAMPRGAKAAVNPEISAAPATPPSVPRTVIPPEVPRVTLPPEVMRRGGKGE